MFNHGNGHCDKCSCAALQNEVHVLFQLLSEKYSNCYQKNILHLFPFLPFHQSLRESSSVGPLLYFACLIRLSLISSRRNNKLPYQTFCHHHELPAF